MGQRQVQVRPSPPVAGLSEEPLQWGRLPLCRWEEGVWLVFKLNGACYQCLSPKREHEVQQPGSTLAGMHGKWT